MFLLFHCMYNCSEADICLFSEEVFLLQFLAVSLYCCGSGSLINYFSTVSLIWSCYIDGLFVQLLFNCLPTFRKWGAQLTLGA